jgi:6-phosphogluconolactonase
VSNMKMNRRVFAAGVAAMPLALRSMAEQAPAVRHPKFVLLGTDKGKGIYRATWDEATGRIGRPELAIETERPTYFAMHPRKSVLYAANEANKGDGSVSAFKLEERGAELSALGVVGSKGNAPCYISLDETGKSLFAANYGGGNLAAFHVKNDGALAETQNVFTCVGNNACGELGPVTDRQDAPHLHSAVVSPDNKFLVVCNLGQDSIEIFPIDPQAEQPLLEPTRIVAPAGSGPRHVAFHPNGRWVYCIHELDCTVNVFEWKAGRGSATMVPLGDSVMHAGKAGPGNSGCEVIVSDHGRFVYANTRGENSLAVYEVNEKTGLLKEIQRIDTAGNVTRLIAIDPSRRWMLCMNQGSSTVTVFTRDPKSGKLSTKGATFEADTPMCVEWV